MDGKEVISFTFPDIHDFWVMLVSRNLISVAVALSTFLVEFAHRRAEVGEQWLLGAYLLFGAVSLAASLVYWSHQNKLIPRINQRFAIEFMLRTGCPIIAGDIDVLEVKRTLAARDQDGNTCLWSVKRRRDVFTVAPASLKPRFP